MQLRADVEHDAVIDCDAGHQVVVAPPGTGKTHVSVRLAGSLAERLSPSERVLLLTFSRQARAQLEAESARQLTRAHRRYVEITNYHRLCWQGVMAYRRLLGLPDRVEMVSTRQRVKVLAAATRDGARAVQQHTGLAESLAEHAFAEFRDSRTPSQSLLVPLLAAVDAEHRAGRLVFDDLGALFWRLLKAHPAISSAFTKRYPIVIADEHQDASALQDAIVRHLGTRRLVVLADHMQLIHGYRGADIERLRAHWRDSQTQHRLTTPHRWRATPEHGAWLLALRERLGGAGASAPRPQAVVISNYQATRGMNGALACLKWTVPKLFPAGMRSVAVLVRQNSDLGRVRNYLANNGMRPRQLGGSKDFEEARYEVEQLPLLSDGQTLALFAHERLLALVPTIPKSVAEQLRRRLQPNGPKLSGAKQPAGAMLEAFALLYQHGAGAYFPAMGRLIDLCMEAGYHLPRPEAIRIIRRTAADLAPDDAIEDCLARYGAETAASLHRSASRTDRGLFVMTAHQAKGKEFDAVVLFSLDARRWPDDDDHRKLIYVALTRATRSWTLISPDTAPSPLLTLIP